jgi:hypothetical protein
MSVTPRRGLGQQTWPRVVIPYEADPGTYESPLTNENREQLRQPTLPELDGI